MSILACIGPDAHEVVVGAVARLNGTTVKCVKDTTDGLKATLMIAGNQRTHVHCIQTVCPVVQYPFSRKRMRSGR